MFFPFSSFSHSSGAAVSDKSLPFYLIFSCIHSRDTSVIYEINIPSYSICPFGRDPQSLLLAFPVLWGPIFEGW